MGFRFRKSIKAGPVRINLSKSGIGYSIGSKGFRYTKKANGGTRATYSIPGTGLSHVSETTAKKKGTSTKQHNANSQIQARAILTVTQNNCPVCGNEINPLDTSCSVCGELISSVLQSKDAPESPMIKRSISEDIDSTAQKKPIYKRWWFIWIAASLIYCCISLLR